MHPVQRHDQYVGDEPADREQHHEVCKRRMHGEVPPDADEADTADGNQRRECRGERDAIAAQRAGADVVTDAEDFGQHDVFDARDGVFDDDGICREEAEHLPHVDKDEGGECDQDDGAQHDAVARDFAAAGVLARAVVLPDECRACLLDANGKAVHVDLDRERRG